MVVRAAMALLFAAAALAAQVPQRFSLGDSRERVRQVQGTPDVIERLPSLGREVWNYGPSSVSFDPHSGRVDGYLDGDRRLKLVFLPRVASASARGHTAAGAALAGPLSLGASRDDVLRRFGTPWAYTRDARARHAFLAYGRSIVRLALDDERVDGWIVRDSAIRVDDRDRAAGELAMGVRREGASARDAIAPATLRGTVQWHDDDRDGVLAPGEAARLVLTIGNDGPGQARAVRAALRIESPSAGVIVSDVPPSADIAVSRTSTFAFRLRADSTQSASEVVAVVSASEANGFDLAPDLRLRIPARPAGAPRLVVRDTRIDDASHDGRLAPREIADLTIRLTNAGPVATPRLRARLWRGGDLFLAAGARDTFSLGALETGADATISLSVYTNSRATDTSLRLELFDQGGRVLGRFPIELPLTGRASGVLDVVAERDSLQHAAARHTGAATRGPSSSRSDDVERDLPRSAARRSDAIAVILGVERYRALPDARFAASDASLMRRYAVQALGINDDVEHLYFRSGADVTGGEMRKLFGETGWLARRVTANTDLVVYFAGHGAPDAARRLPFLLPFDADPAFVSETGYALGELYDRLARLPARSITILLDACFSGATRGGQSIVVGTRPTVLSIEHPALVRRQMAVLTASRDAQVAGDLPEARHGLFTYWLARGLRGEADANRDDAITMAELGRFTELRVRETAARLDRDQRPLMIARDSLTVLARLAPAR